MDIPDLGNYEIREVLRTEPLSGPEALADFADGAQSTLVVSLAAMQATGFTTFFDWQEEFQGRENLLNDPAVIDTADLDLLRKIMTAHIRIDRMSPDHLNELVASGYWQRCFNRLRQLLAAREGRE